MIKGIGNLNTEQTQILYNTPVLVCVLVAGADDDIDNNEIKKSLALTKENAKASRSHIYDYYQEIAVDFERKLASTIENLPASAADRDPMIIEELKKINDIFKIIDKPFAIVLYASLKELALKVAKASGGVMGMQSISKDEAKYISLSMIKDPALIFKSK